MDSPVLDVHMSVYSYPNSDSLSVFVEALFDFVSVERMLQYTTCSRGTEEVEDTGRASEERKQLL